MTPEHTQQQKENLAKVECAESLIKIEPRRIYLYPHHFLSCSFFVLYFLVWVFSFFLEGLGSLLPPAVVLFSK